MKRNFIFVTLTMLWLTMLIMSNCAHAQSNVPFDAWVSSREDVFLKASFDNRYTSIALLRYGDTVKVVECRPDCDSQNSWVRLEPFGVLRRSNLETLPMTREAFFLSGSPSQFMWGKIKRDTVSREQPNNDSQIVDHYSRGNELILRRNRELFYQGYVERPDGSFISTDYVEIFEPSEFHGWENPPTIFAFAIRDFDLNRQAYYRYDTFSVEMIEGNDIITSTGLFLPRDKVRIGYQHPRPSSIPTAARRWVHIDLEQQVLTAYEDDNLVYGTLVSTGRRRGSTHRGTFQVRRKINYTQMRGRGYSVEGVPWVQYLTEANEHVALHVSFWRDDFGYVRSHGCINLSPFDGKWLFDFNKATIPLGWRSIHPIELNLESLWVVIE